MCTMVNEPDTRARRIWQAQGDAEAMMAVDELREKAARLDAKRRREKVAGRVAVGLLVALSAWELWTTPDWIEFAADLLVIAAFIYIGWRYYRYHLSAGPAALGRSTGVEHYRAELRRQRDLAADSWGYLLPFVPGVALNIVGGALAGRSRGQGAFVVGLAVALFLGAAAINARTARRHQRELDALDAL
jgi:hypothetical protein